jgi:hypothetical protein
VPLGRSRLLISDWVSNLYRIRDLIAQIDKPGFLDSKTQEIQAPETALPETKTTEKSPEKPTGKPVSEGK